MENLYTQKVINANNVFDDRFMDTKTLYLHCFNMLPCLSFIGQINGEKAFDAFHEKFSADIRQVLTYRWYKRNRKKYQFGRTVIVLNNNCLVEITDGYCEILHDGISDKLVSEITMLVNRFKGRQKRQPLEINLVVKSGSYLDLKPMEIKRTKLDMDLFYEDDFKPIDELIQKRLGKKKDNGIVLLHGLPGTGKTSYIRYLVGKIKKRVLFLSPSVAGDLMDPEFIELLINNPNTVLVIEDAESIIKDRRYSNNSAVSNLLNISDGLLADFLNVQLICTFNNSLASVDSALMRKGRLIARYEFGKLGVQKAQRLSYHFGFNEPINKPMTIAELAHQNEMEQPPEKVEVIGFRRQVLVN